jgi:hypothetical protein
MAYLALHRIHLFLGNKSDASEWEELLLREGGERAVARPYIEAIHDALVALDSEAASILPLIEEE